MFTIAVQPKSVASHLRFVQPRKVQDSLLLIPISGQGSTDIMHPAFMMIFIAAAIAVCLQAILAMPVRICLEYRIMM